MHHAVLYCRECASLGFGTNGQLLMAHDPAFASQEARVVGRTGYFGRFA